MLNDYIISMTYLVKYHSRPSKYPEFCLPKKNLSYVNLQFKCEICQLNKYPWHKKQNSTIGFFHEPFKYLVIVWITLLLSIIKLFGTYYFSALGLSTLKIKKSLKYNYFDETTPICPLIGNMFSVAIWVLKLKISKHLEHSKYFFTL